MKKLFCALILLCLISLEGFSQDIRFNVYGSYVFADKFDSYWDIGNNYYYDGRIEDGFQWGGGIEYIVNDMVGIEVLYLRQDTNSPTRYSYSGFIDRYTNFDMGINYILVAPSKYFKAPSGNLEGFAGVMAGVVVANLYNPDNGNENNATKMAWGIKAGGVYWGSERVGLKLQAQLLSAVQSVGGGFYFGTGGGGAGVSSYSSIYQFSLGGGLVFKVN